MITKASKNDIDRIMQIVSDIVKEMIEIKNYQWNEAYPTSSVFMKDIENNNLYIYKDEFDKILGFICIDDNQAIEYSSVDWQYSNDAFVIHRMAVDVNARGLGIGKVLMKYAEELAKENGVNAIRSDTYSTNKSMNIVFDKSGYRFAGEINLMERPLPFKCYEKQLVF